MTTFRVIPTLVQLFCASIITIMTFQSPELLNKVLFAASWFAAGVVIGRVWSLPDDR